MEAVDGDGARSIGRTRCTQPARPIQDLPRRAQGVTGWWYSELVEHRTQDRGRVSVAGSDTVCAEFGRRQFGAALRW
jgi:hypothetical protein